MRYTEGNLIVLFIMTTPTDRELLHKARVLIQESGMDFAISLEKKYGPTRLSIIAFARRDLGPNAPEKTMVEAMRENPLLWEKDDGSDEYLAQARAFFNRVEKAVEAVGPAILETGVQPSERHIKSEKMVQARAQVAVNLDEHHGRILNMIRNEPEKAVQSAITRLMTDTVPWENSLIVLAQQAATPAQAQLMVVLGSLCRKQLLEDVFEDEDLIRIAELSTGVWRSGKHNDLEHLRRRAAEQLGIVLNNPQRRPAVEAVLAEHLPNRLLPAALTDAERQTTIRLAQGHAEAMASQILEMFEERVEIEGVMGLVVSHFRTPHWKDALSDEDWLALGLQTAEGMPEDMQTSPEAQSWAYHLWVRTEAAVLAQLPQEALGPQAPENPDAEAPRSMEIKTVSAKPR